MSGISASDLLKPAVYFPLSSGRFTVAPGFCPITTSFGNGVADYHLFQIDRDFFSSRANTVAARAERLDKYVCTEPDFDDFAAEVCQVMIDHLLTEHPGYFDWQEEPGGAGTLICHLTGEQLRFDSERRLLKGEGGIFITPTYRNGFDALASQVSEDIAIIALPEHEPDRNVALHITAPSHWVPKEKIGMSFRQTHLPVPHFARIASASATLLEMVHDRKPVVRFNWGIEFTDRLNLHPEPPPGRRAEEWNFRGSGIHETGPIYLRIERQVLLGLKKRGLLFSIRVYVRPVEELTFEERNALCQTLFSMPEESRIYKGLSPETFIQVVDRLKSLSGQ